MTGARYNAAGPGGASIQVRWSEHEAECLENALDEVGNAIRHSAGICAHVRDLVSEAAPGNVPIAVSSILQMTFLALDALSHRECETLEWSNSHIWRARQAAIREREAMETQAKGKEAAE